MRIFCALLLLLVSVPSIAADYPAFAPMPKEYLSAPGEVIEVRNMPEVRDQGGFPECHAFAEWYALMHFQCKVEGKDCKHLDPKTTPSPALLSIFNTDERAKLGIKEFRDAILFSAGGDPEKGQSFLYSDDQPFPLYSDSCFPMEQLLHKFGGAQ